MVDTQLRARGICDERIREAMCHLPRHQFVPEAYRASAYDDRPLPVGYGQTISQPYMVAVMMAALEPKSSDSVLEVGTGSGYQAALLSCLVDRVVTFEWVPELAEQARANLEELNIHNVRVYAGDGSCGTGGNERYEGIIIAAGAPMVPMELREQLAEGGRLVIPLGSRLHQELTVIRRVGEVVEEDRREGCVFVPLQGQYAW